MARVLYIMVGDTSTGKGLLMEAMERACGSFVGTFDVNNFVYNPNNGADAAKQLSWLKLIADKRVAFSSEARQGSTLCGVQIKKAVSGGDTLIYRSNHKDEEEGVVRATLFILCNDVPKVQPCDDATLNRIPGVFEKHVRFLDKVNPFRPDYEKKIDCGLKDLFRKPEYQDAFLSTLLDAYQEYRKAGHIIPKSVSEAVGQWVVNEAGLPGLLALVFDTELDAHGQPDSGGACHVPFDDIKRALLVDGVGPEHKKVSMSESKLGMQLTSLGYKSTVKNIRGKSTRVRLGLSWKKHVSESCENSGSLRAWAASGNDANAEDL
jgi:hypothetical protein